MIDASLRRPCFPGTNSLLTERTLGVPLAYELGRVSSRYFPPTVRQSHSACYRVEVLVLRGSGEGWASAFLNRAGDRSFFGHLRPSSAFCPPHLLRLGYASPFRCASRTQGLLHRSIFAGRSAVSGCLRRWRMPGTGVAYCYPVPVPLGLGSRAAQPALRSQRSNSLATPAVVPSQSSPADACRRSQASKENKWLVPASSSPPRQPWY